MILFLDDDPNRTESFLRMVPGAEVRTFTTANETIEFLKTAKEPPSITFLDHDLGGEIYVDSDREDCGMEVVRWIAANKPPMGKIVVHTHNTPAGNEMLNRLAAAGYEASYVPFLYLKIQVD